MDPKRPKLSTTVKKGILLNTKQDTGRLGPMYTVRQCLLIITKSKIQKENETENYVNIEIQKQNT